MHHSVDAPHWSQDFDQQAASDFFCAVGDSERLNILFKLACKGPSDLEGLRASTRISLPSLADHLRSLVSAGIVRLDESHEIREYSFNSAFVANQLISVIRAIQTLEPKAP